MATRGIYRFFDGDTDNKIDVYNHWDNYPSGAASHLYKMLCEWYNSNGNTLTRFVRSNPNAEIQIGDCPLGGIEYLYEIRGLGNTAKIRAYKVYDNPSPDYCIFDGDLIQFIQQQSKEWAFEIKPFKETLGGLMNAEQAKSILRERFGALYILNNPDKFNRENPNHRESMKVLNDYVEHFPELLDEQDVKEAVFAGV